MTRVEKLEKDVQELVPTELAAFRAWFSKYDSENWDDEIESHIKLGKLQSLADAALQKHKSGKTNRL